jgi:putative transposase
VSLDRHTGRVVDSRAHEGTVAVERSNQRWCSDTFEISCDNGERVRVLFAVDCCDREAINWTATTRGIDSQMVCDLMVESVEKRCATPQAPAIEWLTDNGSCYVARRTQAFAKEIGLVPLTTPIRSP